MTEPLADIARRNYELLNAAYKTGDIGSFVEASCHRDVVIVTAGGGFPEQGEWRGHEGARDFIQGQMEAFEEMWIEPLEFIEAGDAIVVPARFGGRARHSGIAIEFEVVHVSSARNGKVARVEMFTSRAEAMRAAGIDE